MNQCEFYQCYRSTFTTKHKRIIIHMVTLFLEQIFFIRATFIQWTKKHMMSNVSSIAYSKGPKGFFLSI